MSRLDKKLAAVRDEDSFLDFIAALAADRADEVKKEARKPSPPYCPGANGWENGRIETFLGAAVCWADDWKRSFIQVRVWLWDYFASHFLDHGDAEFYALGASQLMGLLSPNPPDTWTRVCLRCLILACLLFLGLELWSSGQHFHIRSETQGAPRMVGAFFGLVLFLSSLAGLRRARALACVGLLVSILAMLLALLPTMAYN